MSNINSRILKTMVELKPGEMSLTCMKGCPDNIASGNGSSTFKSSHKFMCNVNPSDYKQYVPAISFMYGGAFRAEHLGGGVLVQLVEGILQQDIDEPIDDRLFQSVFNMLTIHYRIDLAIRLFEHCKHQLAHVDSHDPKGGYHEILANCISNKRVKSEWTRYRDEMINLDQLSTDDDRVNIIVNAIGGFEYKHSGKRFQWVIYDLMETDSLDNLREFERAVKDLLTITMERGTATHELKWLALTTEPVALESLMKEWMGYQQSHLEKNRNIWIDNHHLASYTDFFSLTETNKRVVKAINMVHRKMPRLLAGDADRWSTPETIDAGMNLFLTKSKYKTYPSTVNKTADFNKLLKYAKEIKGQHDPLAFVDFLYDCAFGKRFVSPLIESTLNNSQLAGYLKDFSYRTYKSDDLQSFGLLDERTTTIYPLIKLNDTKRNDRKALTEEPNYGLSFDGLNSVAVNQWRKALKFVLSNFDYSSHELIWDSLFKRTRRDFHLAFETLHQHAIDLFKRSMENPERTFYNAEFERRLLMSNQKIFFDLLLTNLSLGSLRSFKAFRLEKMNIEPGRIHNTMERIHNFIDDEGFKESNNQFVQYNYFFYASKLGENDFKRNGIKFSKFISDFESFFGVKFKIFESDRWSDTILRYKFLRTFEEEIKSINAALKYMLTQVDLAENQLINTLSSADFEAYFDHTLFHKKNESSEGLDDFTTI